MSLDPNTIPPAQALRELAETFGVRRFALFGSALRDDFTPESDIDVLVEYQPGARTGLRFFALQE
ncbi:MAG: nucleotidyltransferase domain-containing protein, partial [Thermoanaerobaculia bacterium]|nr:nucleotidyltransferase domain-containing protein [Thermoanaerobaculia bacterium]